MQAITDYVLLMLLCFLVFDLNAQANNNNYPILLPSQANKTVTLSDEDSTPKKISSAFHLTSVLIIEVYTVNQTANYH